MKELKKQIQNLSKEQLREIYYEVIKQIEKIKQKNIIKRKIKNNDKNKKDYHEALHHIPMSRKEAYLGNVNFVDIDYIEYRYPDFIDFIQNLNIYDIDKVFKEGEYSLADFNRNIIKENVFILRSVTEIDGKDFYYLVDTQGYKYCRYIVQIPRYWVSPTLYKIHF